jgi:hypothetical protein
MLDHLELLLAAAGKDGLAQLLRPSAVTGSRPVHQLRKSVNISEIGRTSSVDTASGMQLLHRLSSYLKKEENGKIRNACLLAKMMAH